MNELIAQTMSDYITSALFWYFSCKVLGCRINKFLAFVIQVFIISYLGPLLTKDMPQAASMAAAVATVFAEFIFLYKKPLKMRIIAAVVCYTAINIIIIIPFYFALALEMENETYRALVFNAMYLAIGFCLFYLLVQMWNNISFVFSNAKFLTFFLLPLTQFAMSVFVVFYLSHNPVSGAEHAFQIQTNRSAVIIFTSVLALSLLADGLFLNGFAKLATGIRERALIEQLEQKNELSYAYIKSMKRDIEDMNKYRHDTINLLGSLKLAIDRGGGEGRTGALEMIDTLTNSVKKLTGGQYCGNIMVNCILTYIQAKLERDGTEAALRAEIPDDTGINDLDLCRLLMNMLDNAREGCLAAGDDNKRSVSFNMRVKDGFLYAVCRNSRAGGELDLATGKEDKKHHGLGLQIMREVAEKYGGDIIIEPEEGAVTVTAALRMPESAEKTDDARTGP